MRKLVSIVALCILVVAPGVGFAAGGSDAAADQATTVKSGKSNSSERSGAGAGGGEAADSTSVKSGKSNSSDRAGAPNAGAGGTTVKGSKSNSSE